MPRQKLHVAFGLGVLLCLAGTPARAWFSPVPDIVVYCEPGLVHALTMAGQRYRKQKHVKVQVFAAPPFGIDGLIAHRARDDVVVANAATIAMLSDKMLLLAAPRATIGADPYVLVTPAGSAIGKGESLRQIVDRHMLVVTDPTSAASFDGRAVLARIEPRAMPHYPLIGVATTQDVLFSVTHGADRVGVAHLSDVRGMKGLMVLAMPPDARVAPTRIVAATTRNGQSRDEADFVMFLQSPEVQGDLRADGLEGAP